MPLVILPKSTDPNGPAKARALLDGLILDPLTVLAVIGGEGPEPNAAVEMAVSRASVKPALRRVVWIPDKEVLKPSERENFFPSDTVLATIGLGDAVAARLPAAQAKVRIFVEKAFLSAEEQEP